MWANVYIEFIHVMRLSKCNFRTIGGVQVMPFCGAEMICSVLCIHISSNFDITLYRSCLPPKK